MKPKASYLSLDRPRWSQIVERALERLSPCKLCPHQCGVHRHQNEKGRCQIGRKCLVASFGPHMGEEPCLTGTKGSGTIFFSRCNLLCVFCQNCQISHEGLGYEIEPDDLAEMMLEIQTLGCHNLNLVTPSHVVPQILEALQIATEQGLTLPIVYNTSGYDNVETLKLLEGIIDIYLPDIKFFDSKVAARFTRVSDYAEVVQLAVAEMHRQVGDLELDENGLAQRGLLVRHLVMPQDLGNTKAIMEFLVQKISPNTYVNLMGQYHPCGPVWGFPELRHNLTAAEYQKACDETRQAGIHRLAIRPAQQFYW